MHRSIQNTSVIICGPISKSTPPNQYVTSGIPAACLASNAALTLTKRTEIFSLGLGSYKYTCNVHNTTKNLYSDCTNTMAVLCNTSDPTWSSDAVKRGRCRNAVNDMYGGMNSWWQAVRKQCGQWFWTDLTTKGVYPSDNCATANANLRTNAEYIREDGIKVKIDSKFTNSQDAGLWNKVTTA